MIQTTGELRLYPYGVTIPGHLAPKWHLEVGNGCHILRPRFKTPMSDHDIKRDLRAILNGFMLKGMKPNYYQGAVEGCITVDDTEDPENTMTIHVTRNSNEDPWGVTSRYEGEERYDTGM